MGLNTSKEKTYAVTTLERWYCKDSTYLLSLLKQVARRLNLPSVTVYGFEPDLPKTDKKYFTAIVIRRDGTECLGFINRYWAK